MAFLCVAAEDFGPVGNGKVLLNGPWATPPLLHPLSLFGIIVIAAIFGTSILRDFQRDTYQLLFTKPISKFDYLGGRWAGSFVAIARLHRYDVRHHGRLLRSMVRPLPSD